MLDLLIILLQFILVNIGFLQEPFIFKNLLKDMIAFFLCLIAQLFDNRHFQWAVELDVLKFKQHISIIDSGFNLLVCQYALLLKSLK